MKKCLIIVFIIAIASLSYVNAEELPEEVVCVPNTDVYYGFDCTNTITYNMLWFPSIHEVENYYTPPMEYINKPDINPAMFVTGGQTETFS